MAKKSFLQHLPSTRMGAASVGEFPFAHAPPRTLTEQVYTRLRSDIIETRLPPGSKLRIEHLRQQYGVGAGTLREALTRLVSDALVSAEGQRGFRVTPLAIDDLDDLTRLRVQIETEALRQSIRHGNSAWREQLRISYEALSAFEQPLTPERRQQWEILNLQFHEALLAGSPSAWTQKVLQLLARHGERYRCFAMRLPGLTRDVHAEHTQIYQAALSGQEARAALALEVHIWATPHELIKALREGRVVLPGDGERQESPRIVTTRPA